MYRDHAPCRFAFLSARASSPRGRQAETRVSTPDNDRFFGNARASVGRRETSASERANQTVICNQLKANKPAADWTTVAAVRRENGNNNSGSLGAVYGLFPCRHRRATLNSLRFWPLQPRPPPSPYFLISRAFVRVTRPRARASLNSLVRFRERSPVRCPMRRRLLRRENYGT